MSDSSTETTSPRAIKAVLRHYIGQYRKYPASASLAFLLPAFGTILVFFVPPLILGRLVDIFSARGVISLESVWFYIFIFAVSWFTGEIMWRVGTHFLVKIKTVSFRDLDRKAFQLLLGREYSFYANNFVGSLTNKAHHFSSGFEVFTDILHYNLFTNVFTILFAIIVLWSYSPILPLLLLGCITTLFLIAIPLIKRRSALVAIRHKASSKISGRLSDVLTNVTTIKSFASEDIEYKAYGEHADDFANKYKRAANFHNLRIDTRISPVYVLTNTLGLIVAIFLAEKLGLQAGVVIVVFSYYLQVTNIFWQINYTYRSIESAIGGAAEFTQLFLDNPVIVDKTSTPIEVNDGEVEFIDVSFSYPENRDNSDSFLQNFDLLIKSGQRVGLVGPSGGGKTTITKLVLRFMDVQKGGVFIDNQNVASVTQKSLREAIAYIPQDPLLFHRTLRENIAYGNPVATDEQVRNAAKLAHADEFISKLPHGYDTLVGERGIKLSGGQRQRIAIARALLKDSKILVLDEATSALDSESEKYIQEGLWQLMKNKTAIVIAHRLSTIKHLDRIIVLDNGKIVQDGSHEELVKQKTGLYAKLWGHQSGGFLEE